jgi:hypothetical protein
MQQENINVEGISSSWMLKYNQLKEFLEKK